jgi:hypothetical protein
VYRVDTNALEKNGGTEYYNDIELGPAVNFDSRGVDRGAREPINLTSLKFGRTFSTGRM